MQSGSKLSGKKEMKRDCNIVTSERYYSPCDKRIMLVIGATGRTNVYRFHTKSDTYIFRHFTACGVSDV